MPEVEIGVDNASIGWLAYASLRLSFEAGSRDIERFHDWMLLLVMVPRHVACSMNKSTRNVRPLGEETVVVGTKIENRMSRAHYLCSTDRLFSES